MQVDAHHILISVIVRMAMWICHLLHHTIMVVRMFMSMRMTVSVPMRMSMSVSVIMAVSVVSMPDEEQSNEVHDQASDAHSHQFAQMLELYTFHESFKRLPDYFHTDDQEKDPITKTRKSLYFPIAVGKASVRWPFFHYRCYQARGQTHAVEEHMYAVAQQAEGARYERIERLYKHESEIDAHEVDDPSRFFVFQYVSDQRVVNVCNEKVSETRIGFGVMMLMIMSMICALLGTTQP